MMLVETSRLTPRYGARILAVRISIISTQADIKRRVRVQDRENVTKATAPTGDCRESEAASTYV